jgi:site-specific DNA recombinase
MSAAAIYARYSSDLQREASIEDQIRICRERAAREGWSVYKCYSDHGISGASLIRPGIQKLLQDALEGRFGIVVTESLDRLSRDQEDIAHIFKRISFAGGRIVTLSEGEINELHIGLKGMMGALYLKDLADKTRRGLRGRVEAGKSGGGNSYGYDVVRGVGPDGQPMTGERRINAGEAAIVRRIFEEYAGGVSPRAIGKKLNADGVPGPSGGTWGPSTIHGNRQRGTGILNNELYIGRLVWNRLRYVKDPETGKRVSRLNPDSGWIVQDVGRLRIVDQDLWERVKTRQGALEARSQSAAEAPGYWDRRRPRYLFTGLMRCAVCGGGIVNFNKVYIGCANARNKGTCDNRATMRRDDLESAVLDGLQNRLMEPARTKIFCEEYARVMNHLHAERNAQRKMDEGALTRTERDLARLVQALLDGVPASAVRDKMAELEAGRDALRRQLAADEDTGIRLHPNMAGYYRAQIADLRTALTVSGRRMEAAEIVRKLVDRIELKPVIRQGRKTLSVGLYGRLAGILAMATKAKAPLDESDAPMKVTKLVAGVRNKPTPWTEASKDFSGTCLPHVVIGLPVSSERKRIG